MANRTVKFYGLGFNPEPVSITVTVDGTQVFSGAIPTIDQAVPNVNAARSGYTFEELLSFEVPMDFDGTKPVSLTVNNGAMIFADEQANYTLLPNPVFTPEQFQVLIDPNRTRQQSLDIIVPLANPPFTSAQIDLLTNISKEEYKTLRPMLQEHNVLTLVTSGVNGYRPTLNAFEGTIEDNRLNVVINGVPENPERAPTYDGTWNWTLYAGDVMTYDLQISRGGDHIPLE